MIHKNYLISILFIFMSSYSFASNTLHITSNLTKEEHEINAIIEDTNEKIKNHDYDLATTNLLGKLHKYHKNENYLLFTADIIEKYSSYNKISNFYNYEIKTHQNLINLRLQFAKFLIKKKQYQKAIIILKPIKNDINNSQDYLSLLAYSYFMNKDYTKAKDIYSALSTNSQNKKLHTIYSLGLAASQYNLGELKSSLKIYQKIASNNNTSSFIKRYTNSQIKLIKTTKGFIKKI